MAQLSSSADVPDLGRRQFMNLLTFGAASGVALGMLYPIVKYFIPPSSGGVGGGVTAKDALGNDIIVSKFLAAHKPGERVLAQGLKGDPTYLVVQDGGLA
ncbi:MAG: cytochrome b6-f complex iron-sulfur subunit, partial [Cyanobacteria bacterium]|nr:cytochrome b6-f complex iron-sulfur subunit [Cyanobacteriota bacterium]MDW8203207.1 cytochrome b6-f complex iron-sulfur subunit [Cyanobacteriota bacterium SKYGB_h_bin112]